MVCKYEGEKKDCEEEKRGCKNCYWDDVKIDKNIDKFLQKMEN